MGRALDEAIWGQRRLWVEKQRKSGLSMAQFCRVNELSISNFYAWKQRLDAEPSGIPLANGKVMTKHVRDRGVFVQMPAPAPERDRAARSAKRNHQGEARDCSDQDDRAAS